MSIPENGTANKARDELLRTAQRARRLEFAIVVLAGIAVVFASLFAVLVGAGNRQIVERIKDCSEPTGKCYRANQQATAKAVQSILDYIDRSFAPHRLRNEAENRCGVETVWQMLSNRPLRDLPFYESAYDICVLSRSGNTAPPPVPPNPLTTTTTTGGKK